VGVKDVTELYKHHAWVAQPPEDAAWYIFRRGDIFYARNGDTGEVEYRSNNPRLVFEYMIARMSRGERIHVCSGVYLVDSTVSSDKLIYMEGEGPASQIRPTGAFDALDLTNIRVIDLLHVDKDGVEWDASFDPNTFEVSLRRTVTRNEILLENLSVSPPAGATATVNTHDFRIIPARKIRISFYYESDANITSLKIAIRALNRAGTFIDNILLRDLPTGTTGRMTLEADTPDGCVYADVLLEGTSGAAVGTAKLEDIVVFGPAIPHKKPWRERNPIRRPMNWVGTVLAGEAWTTRWSYTVPSGKAAMLQICDVYKDNTLTNNGANIDMYQNGTSITVFTGYYHSDYARYLTPKLVLLAGDNVKGFTRNADTADHAMAVRANIIEFDQD